MCHLSVDPLEMGHPEYINGLIYVIPIIHLNELKWKHFMWHLSIYEANHSYKKPEKTFTHRKSVSYLLSGCTVLNPLGKRIALHYALKRSEATCKGGGPCTEIAVQDDWSWGCTMGAQAVTKESSDIYVVFQIPVQGPSPMWDLKLKCLWGPARKHKGSWWAS